MRRTGYVGLLVTIGALTQGESAGAAPLDFLFGGPPLASRPAYRLRRRPAPPLTQEVPLPVPRPHFSDDPVPKPATATETAKPPAPTAKPPEAAPSQAPLPQPPNARAPAAARQPPTVEAPALPVPSSQAPTPASKDGEPDTGVPLPPPKPAELQPSPAAKPQAEVPVPTPPAPKGPPLGPSLPPAPPPKPADLPSPPAAGTPAAPAVAPSGATTAFTPRSPEDDPQCPTRLVAQKVGIETTVIGPQPDPRCTVIEPVHLDDVTMPDGSKVAFPEHPTIACVTADSFASYVRDMLSPLAKGTFGAPVAAVWTGPGLECRSRDHVFGAKLSAHGQGLAIDIAKLKLTDGRVIEVGTPKTDAETAFETAARAGACGYFHTVLGPGSDSYHRTHWHFDLEVRGAHDDSKYCK